MGWGAILCSPVELEARQGATANSGMPSGNSQMRAWRLTAREDSENSYTEIQHIHG